MAFCWFILFPPLVLCFFFPLFLVLITSTTQTNFSSPSAHFPINPLPHPSLSSFLSTFSRAGNLGHAWPPCPRQPRYTRSYSLASRRVHACPEANTLQQATANQDLLFEGLNSTLTLGIYAQELKIRPWNSLKAYSFPYHLYETHGMMQLLSTVMVLDVAYVGKGRRQNRREGEQKKKICREERIFEE